MQTNDNRVAFKTIGYTYIRIESKLGNKTYFSGLETRTTFQRPQLYLNAIDTVEETFW